MIYDKETYKITVEVRADAIGGYPAQRVGHMTNVMTDIRRSLMDEIHLPDIRLEKEGFFAERLSDCYGTIASINIELPPSLQEGGKIE